MRAFHFPIMHFHYFHKLSMCKIMSLKFFYVLSTVFEKKSHFFSNSVDAYKENNNVRTTILCNFMYYYSKFHFLCQCATKFMLFYVDYLPKNNSILIVEIQTTKSRSSLLYFLDDNTMGCYYSTLTTELKTLHFRAIFQSKIKVKQMPSCR